MKFFICAFLTALCLTSCREPKPDLDTYIRHFNTAVASEVYGQDNLLNSQATLKNSNTIAVVIQVDAPNNDFYKQYFGNIQPYMAMALSGDEQTRKRIDEGIAFHLTITAADKSLIRTFTIDKRNLTAMLAKLENKRIENPVNPNGIIPGNRVIPHELSRNVNHIRRGLPIRNDANGMTITDIDINKDIELEYHITVDDSIAKRLTNPVTLVAVKKEVIRTADLGALYQHIGNFGVRTLYYKYFNRQHEELGSFWVSYQELWSRTENAYGDPQ